MSSYQRGSEWRRWDLHVHTPGTVKNDGFSGTNSDEKWDIFYRDIANYVGDASDPTKNIAVIGITDYLSVKNYRKVVSDECLPASVIFTLPNVEMRIIPIARHSPINIHFLFNPIIIDDVESRFFSKLSFRHGSTDFSASETELIRLGRLNNKSLNDEDAYITGIEQFIPSFRDVQDVFAKDPDLRKDTIILVSNSSNDGVSGAVDHTDYFDTRTGDSQLKTLRQSIYRFVDGVFSATPTDMEYFLGKKQNGSEKLVVKDIGKLMPCLHGSDAHKNVDLFEPDEYRYCWIKADPTFNGLKQIVYEPEERVCISATKPQVKPSYQVIESITITHPDFQSEPVVFNDKLNCIIGGKSTGKTTLLHNLARAIDLKQVDDRIEMMAIRTKGNERIKPMALEFDPSTISVKWLDGAKSTDRKIIYIPQTYLNRLVDSPEETTVIDNIVEQTVLDNEDTEGKPLSDAKCVLVLSINERKSSITTKLLELISKHERIEYVKEQSANLGIEELVRQEIADLKSERDKQSQALELSDKDITTYDLAVANIRTQSQILEQAETEITRITNITKVVKSTGGDLGLSEETLSEVRTIVDALILTANETWNKRKSEIIDYLESKKDASIKSKGDSTSDYNRLKGKIEMSHVIKELTSRITIECDKLKQIESYKHEILECNKQFDILLNEISEFVINIKSDYQTYADYINTNVQNRDEDFSYSVQIPFRLQDFITKWIDVFGIKSSKGREIVNVDKFSSVDYTIQLIKTIINKTLDGSIVPKKNVTKEQALRNILGDWYNIKYVVRMGYDTIEKMSAGNKALVLLKLLIELADSSYPILIDQPEDDLDNRSVYNSLIEFIKSKKIHRQIIVVTHNANIVLGADADEVIIANQVVLDPSQRKRRFEFRSGSIEDDLPVSNTAGAVKDNILYTQGIQQHICDILEGGKLAFENRKNKYRIFGL